MTSIFGIFVRVCVCVTYWAGSWGSLTLNCTIGGGSIAFRSYNWSVSLYFFVCTILSLSPPIRVAFSFRHTFFFSTSGNFCAFWLLTNRKHICWTSWRIEVRLVCGVRIWGKMNIRCEPSGSWWISWRHFSCDSSGYVSQNDISQSFLFIPRKCGAFPKRPCIRFEPTLFLSGMRMMRMMRQWTWGTGFRNSLCMVSFSLDLAQRKVQGSVRKVVPWESWFK